MLPICPRVASSIAGVSAMKYLVLALIGLLPIAAAFDRCWADGETIAVFTKNQNNPFSQAIRTGSNIAAKTLVARINHYIPSTPDSAAEQMALVDDAIASKPDVVVFDPVDITALAP